MRERRGAGVHSLYDGVDLVAPFGALGFFAIEEYAVLDLRPFQRSRKEKIL